MDVCVFGNYLVKCKGSYSYNTPSYDCPNDWHTEKVRWQRSLSGCKLIEFVSKLLHDDDIVLFTFIDNIIYTEHYCPDGSCAYYRYIITQKK